MDTLTKVLLYGGIGGFGVTLVVIIIVTIVFSISGKKLRDKLEKEYGKRRR